MKTWETVTERDIETLAQEELDAGARVLRVLSNPKCKCGDVGERGRTCPYQADIHDKAVVCGCCDSCEGECRADI